MKKHISALLIIASQALNVLMAAPSYEDPSKALFITKGTYHTPIKPQFYKTIGGKGMDAASAIAKTKSGHFLLAGKTSSYGAGDMNMHLVKVDKSGSVIWDKNFGAEETEEANGIIECSSGGYLLVGFSDSYGSGPDIKDIWVVKVDENGNRSWDKVIGGGESIDEGHSVVETSDGGFMILGTTTPISGEPSDLLLVKISKSGEEVWRKKLGGPKFEMGARIIKSKDGYVISAITDSFGKGRWDVWLIQVDESGNKVWDKTYGGGDNEMVNALQTDTEGNLYFTGYSYSFAQGSHDVWVVKTDSKGTLVWQKNFGGLSTDEGFDLVVTPSMEVVVAGYTDIFEPDEYNENISKEGNNVFVIKLKSDGSEIWKRSIGANGMQRANGIAATDDGGFLLAGATDESEEKGLDALLIKISADGTH